MPAPTGTTRVAAVIGDPVRHSRSPSILNAAFDAAGLDWTYVAFEVPAGGAAEALGGAAALGLGGLSVTMPHKEAVHDLLAPRVTAAAAALRSVNCVFRGEDGRLWGDSTDGAGFVASARDAGIDPAGLRCLVLGAGGAARAVVEALGASGAALVAVHARRADAAGVAAGLAGDAGAVEPDLGAALSSGVDLLVNATPVGMAGTPGADGSPLDAALLDPATAVADLVYHPLRTPLLEAADAAGCRTIDGLGMLVHQAAIAYQRWTLRPAPLAAMHAAARAI